MGYLAFPPGSSLQSIQKPQLTDGHVKQPSDQGEVENDSTEQVHNEQYRIMEELKRNREVREREEALIGEKHWVRQGGMLRDTNGRRDAKRTEEVRRLVEQEDKERRIRERWTAYEDTWTRLSSSSEPVSFSAVPWPKAPCPKGPSELREHTAIANFLFESLSLPENTTTRKDRLRASLLRWHPDKLSGIIARTVENDRDAVKEGIDAVVISLRTLQAEEKSK